MYANPVTSEKVHWFNIVSFKSSVRSFFFFPRQDVGFYEML